MAVSEYNVRLKFNMAVDVNSSRCYKIVSVNDRQELNAIMESLIEFEQPHIFTKVFQISL